MGLVLSVNTFVQEFFEHGPIPNERSRSRVTLGRVVALSGGLACLVTLVSSKDVIYERAAYWPVLLTRRIQDTYVYFGTCVLMGLVSMASVYQSTTIVEFLASHTVEAVVVANIAMFLSGSVVNSLTYTDGFGPKHVAMLLYATTIGGIVSPICYFGAPVIVDAVWMTAAVVSEMFMVSAYLSTEFVFQVLVGPILFGYVITDLMTIVGFFVSTETQLGYRAYQINVYGGAIVCSGCMLVLSHLIYVVAEIIKDEDPALYDPINVGILLFIGSTELFVRLAAMVVFEGNDTR